MCKMSNFCLKSNVANFFCLGSCLVFACEPILNDALAFWLKMLNHENLQNMTFPVENHENRIGQKVRPFCAFGDPIEYLKARNKNGAWGLPSMKMGFSWSKISARPFWCLCTQDRKFNRREISNERSLILFSWFLDISTSSQINFWTFTSFFWFLV